MKHPLSHLLLGLILLSGCSKKQAPTQDPVPIKVTVANVNGRKLALTLHPQDESNKKAQLPAGEIKPDAGLTSGTFSGMAVPGRYKATVAPIVPGGHAPAGGPGGGGSGAPGAQSSLPPRVMDPNQTPLEVTVPAEGDDNIKLTIPDN
jgi:hypothetical protein